MVANMQAILSVSGISKTYASGFQALKRVSLDIRRGEIFALLGPNGAGKTTLISIICGIVNASEGSVRVDGHDIIKDYRAARATIGLVPQELTTDAFESVWATVSFSRGLFGRPRNPAYLEKVLRELSLWDKKDNKIITLSGGMKRRLLIAKALSHEPQILFLDEPTAGVDVNLRRDMWQLVRSLQATGVTIILTTHYIDEAEEMADRIGVIRKGEIILVEDKDELMRKLGKNSMTLQLQTPLALIPPALAAYQMELSSDGSELTYTYDTSGERTGIIALLKDLNDAVHRVQGSAHHAEFARRHLRQPGEGHKMNLQAMRAIYLFEMARTRRTLLQSIVSPVISTSLYFVVFGAAIGSRIPRSTASAMVPSSCPG
jgi:ABC-2 type transport system ATP-binding protein